MVLCGISDDIWYFSAMFRPARCECFPGGITADSPVECVVEQCKCRNDVDKAYAGERCVSLRRIFIYSIRANISIPNLTFHF